MLSHMLNVQVKNEPKPKLAARFDELRLRKPNSDADKSLGDRNEGKSFANHRLGISACRGKRTAPMCGRQLRNGGTSTNNSDIATTMKARDTLLRFLLACVLCHTQNALALCLTFLAM